MRHAAATIIKWEWLILLLLLPLMLFPTGWRGLLLLAVPLLWLFRKIATGYFVPHTPYDVTLLILIAALLLSLTAVFDMALSFPKIAGLILGIACFYAGAQYTRDNDGGIYHLLGLIIVLGMAMAVVGLLGSLQSSNFTFLNPVVSLLPDPIIANLGFIRGGVNPNELAGVLCWVVPLLVACTIGFWASLWRAEQWWLKLILLMMLVMLVFGSLLLLLTKSRGGLLAVFLALMMMLAIRYRWGRWLFLIIILSFVALGIYLDLGTLLQGNMQTAVDLGIQGRMELWSRALYGIADFPFTGMSMNGFRHLVHVLYPLFSIPPDFDVAHAHNHLLQAGLDLGIPGLVAYLGIWVLSAALLWIGWRHSLSHSSQVLIIGLSGSLMAGWIFGVFDAIALGARPGFLWWLLLALLVSVMDQVLFSETKGSKA